jgi:drug/metabolite transporter (DMT)-like permease
VSANPSVAAPIDGGRKGLAYLAAFVVVVIWAIYLVSTRSAMTGAMGVVEIGLVRFLPATLILSPVLLRRGLFPKGVSPVRLAIIALFAGFLFFSSISVAFQFAPVSDSGVFAPGMLPLFTAIAAYVALGERYGPVRASGFALILAGGLAVGGYEAIANSGHGAWRGHILFMTAAALWSIYSVTFRMTGLGALHGAALISFWSAVSFALTALITGVDFAGVGWREIGWQIFAQGVLTSIVAMFAFGFAVREIGPSRTAAFAALTPVLAAVGGWVFLGEEVSQVKWIGIAIVAAGVLLASGVVALRRNLTRRPG